MVSDLTVVLPVNTLHVCYHGNSVNSYTVRTTTLTTVDCYIPWRCPVSVLLKLQMFSFRTCLELSAKLYIFYNLRISLINAMNLHL